MYELLPCNASVLMGAAGGWLWHAPVTVAQCECCMCILTQATADTAPAQGDGRRKQSFKTLPHLAYNLQSSSERPSGKTPRQYRIKPVLSRCFISLLIVKCQFPAASTLYYAAFLWRCENHKESGILNSFQILHIYKKKKTVQMLHKTFKELYLKNIFFLNGSLCRVQLNMFF